MNTVTVTGRLHGDPVTEHLGDLVVGELHLAVDVPGPDRRTEVVNVTCFGRISAIAAEHLAVGDFVGVTGWLRTRPVEADGRAHQRVVVVAERLDFLVHPIEPAVAPDAHLEASTTTATSSTRCGDERLLRAHRRHLRRARLGRRRAVPDDVARRLPRSPPHRRLGRP